MEHFLGIPAVICSHAMRELMRIVQRVVMTPATVLIAGETGCGKERVACALHHGHYLKAARILGISRRPAWCGIGSRQAASRVASLCWSEAGEGGSRV